MANEKLTDRTAASALADGDFIHVVDISDTTDDAAGTSKKSTWTLIKSFLKTYFDTLYIGNLVEDTTPQLGGSLDTNSKSINESKGADVASATALNLGADGNSFDITGTTTITSINTEGIGTVVTLHFDGILILTHHATDLILPGTANITTAVGDIATFYEYASGDWRCVSYTKADGTAIVGAAGGAQSYFVQYNNPIIFTSSTNWYSRGIGPASVYWDISTFATSIGATPTAFDSRIVSKIVPFDCNLTSASISISRVNAGSREINIKGYVYDRDTTSTPVNVREVFDLTWTSDDSAETLVENTDFTVDDTVDIDKDEMFVFVVNQNPTFSAITANIAMTFQFDKR